MVPVPSVSHSSRRLRTRVALRSALQLLFLGGLSVWLAACGVGSLVFGGASPTPTPAASPQSGSSYPFVVSTVIPNPTTGSSYEPAGLVPLAQLTWCRFNTNQVRFWDYGGASSLTTIPTIVTNWSQAQNALGFTVYLPTQLSADTCLTSAEGNLHDPQGNSFQITYAYYLRAYTTRLILLEQAASATSTNLQCSALTSTSSQALEAVAPVTYSSSNPAPSLCTGQRGQTLIQFQAPESSQQLNANFQVLQPDVVFLPRCGCQNTTEHLNRVHF